MSEVSYLVKPCPFCGSKDCELEETETSSQVSCQECFASGPLISESCDTDDDADLNELAVKLWNTRYTG